MTENDKAAVVAKRKEMYPAAVAKVIYISVQIFSINVYEFAKYIGECLVSAHTWAALYPSSWNIQAGEAAKYKLFLSRQA